MTRTTLSLQLALLPVLTVLLTGTSLFAADDLGVAKVNLNVSAQQASHEQPVVRGQSPVVVDEVVYEDCECDNCRGHRCHGSRCCGSGKFHRWVAYHLGYFIPRGGADGRGLPPTGHYHRVYAVDPHHFDQRDGNVYAAQGYGVPIAVPLAPTVHHTYNYSWGIPSSRLTPVGNITSTPY